MKNPFKPISISLSPNTEKDDIRLAWKLIFSSQKWKSGNAIIKLEGVFRNYFRINQAISFNSGRSALLAILKSLDLNDGDEVLFQAFTCNAVVNPIIWAGLKPVYVDCDEETFNIDIFDLKKKITPRSRVVIVQHTFGLPADLPWISEICQENNLILIEDCAHSLGADYELPAPSFEGKKVGTLAKAAFFSFSRDKVISSVYGGMVITNDDMLANKLREFQREIGFPSYFWIFQQLLHPIIMNWLILPTYRLFGKYLLVLFQWSHILSKAVHWKEKRGLMPDYFPKALPNGLAALALNQFGKLERFNNHRRKIAFSYYQWLQDSSFDLPVDPQNVKQVFLRFTLKTPLAHKIIKKAWRKNILIGDWYTSPIAPADTRLEKMGYSLGSCPVAERLAKETLNLPTHINISDSEVQKIIEFLKTFKMDLWKSEK